MAKRKKSRVEPQSGQKTQAANQQPSRTGGWKLWSFRVAALLGVPLVFLGMIELVLRLAGYGCSTSFLVPSTQDGRPVFTHNTRFGWRFFGRELARLPHPFSISRTKPDNTVRIFVFGESAAKGDPDPHFGLARMLEAMLSLRHPGVRFEVVNTAMTAINSHAILPIARDCAAADGDIWVIYMGNNEVVGPFGAGTVFGPQTPSLPLIRGALAIKEFRSGQLLDSLLQRASKSPAAGSGWGGMEMFLDQQVGADDPRMNQVYHHFERNLEDILRLGKRNGVGIVVGTVAVNLKDCAPFASTHRAGMTPDETRKWDELYQRGIAAQIIGRHQEAAAQFAEAEKLDGTFAELRFRQGQCALESGQTAEAQDHFRSACDFDTLRFRCDSRMNEITRKVAANHKSEGIRLADAERVFAGQSQSGVPGENFFYEHVHLKFEGNWLLAWTIAEQAETFFADRLTKPSGETQPWPSLAECARRSGWSEWSQLTGWRGILPRLGRPPFTGQFDHEARMTRVQTELTRLSPAAQTSGISNALKACESALTINPDDWALLRQLTLLRKAASDLGGAIVPAQRAVALIPGDAEGWSDLGLILSRQNRFAEAIAAFQRAVELDPQDMISLEGMAQILTAMGRNDEASAAFQRVVATRPMLGLAWLHYGRLLEKMGRKTEAESCFQRAVANPGQNIESQIELANFCQSRGWFEKAAKLYVEALKSEPANAKFHVGAGQNFAALQRYTEAAYHSSEAVRIAPEFAEAHLLYGLILGRQRLIPQATTQFREALRLKPDLLDARLNLGIALAAQNPVEALSQFEEVLKLNPTNETALKYVRQLRP